MAWTGPKELKAQVQRLWDRGLLLAAVLDDAIEFPLRLKLKTPNSRDLVNDFENARQWVASLQKAKGLRIKLRTFQHRVLGENTVPASAWLDSLEDAIALLHKQAEFASFTQLLDQTRDCEPALLEWVRKKPLKALELAPQWPKLLAVISCLQNRPRPGIYLRQVSIPGIDSKFIEQYRSALIPLLDLALAPGAIDKEAGGINGFEQRYGFRSKPLTQRFRILDSRVTLLPGRDRDISLTHTDFRDLDQDKLFATYIRRVYITENEINFLAFPPMANSLVIFGAGYGFEALRHVDWLPHCEIVYWGDIDTHGFAILDQLRALLPHSRSLLMDESTLLAHRAHWGFESSQESRHLKRLDAAEQRLYGELQSNRFGNQLRLEQEKIDYEFLLAKLS